MKERVDVREWVEFQWPYLIAFLGGAARVQAAAEQTGAFTRSRKIENAEVLLRLILMWPDLPSEHASSAPARSARCR
jgi:hypothetical protein